MSISRITYNIAIIGDINVGKSTFIERRNHNDNIINIPERNVDLKIYKCYSTDNKLLEDVNIHGIIFMFDLTDESSFKSIKGHLDLLRMSFNTPKIICGNKCDLIRYPLLIRKRLHVPYCFISARTGYNCEEPFYLLLNLIEKSSKSKM